MYFRYSISVFLLSRKRSLHFPCLCISQHKIHSMNPGLSSRQGICGRPMFLCGSFCKGREVSGISHIRHLKTKQDLAPQLHSCRRMGRSCKLPWRASSEKPRFSWVLPQKGKEAVIPLVGGAGERAGWSHYRPATPNYERLFRGHLWGWHCTITEVWKVWEIASFQSTGR